LWLVGCCVRHGRRGKKKDDEEKKNRKKKKAFFLLLCVSFGRRRGRCALRNDAIRLITAIRFAAMICISDTHLFASHTANFFFVEEKNDFFL
jgi:hypothetical protein